jgi:hypothetical protein
MKEYTGLGGKIQSIIDLSIRRRLVINFTFYPL